MKQHSQRLLDWFERHFNYWIELFAFLGGVFCLLFAMFLFVVMVFGWQEVLYESSFELVILPGIIGFFGVVILFALRITRYLTQDGPLAPRD